jgi:hypothetical protein
VGVGEEAVRSRRLESPPSRGTRLDAALGERPPHVYWRYALPPNPIPNLLAEKVNDK